MTEIKFNLKFREYPQRECPHCHQMFGGGLLNHVRFCKKNPKRKEAEKCPFCRRYFLRLNCHLFYCKYNPDRGKKKEKRQFVSTEARPFTIYISESLYKKQRKYLVSDINKQVRIDMKRNPREVLTECINNDFLPKDRKIITISVPKKIVEKLEEMKQEGYFKSNAQYIRCVMNKNDK